MKMLCSVMLLALTLPFTSFAANKNTELSQNEKVMLKNFFKYDMQNYVDSESHIFPYDMKLISADKIAEDYDANEARGDKDYKGQAIVISGAVERIRSTLGDVPAVELRTNIGINGVSLYFAKEYEGLAIDLNKGDTVKYACLGDGAVMGSPILRRCVPVSVYVDAVSQNTYKEMLSELNGYAGGNDTVNEFLLFVKMISKITDDYKLCSAADSSCIINLINKTPIEKRKEIGVQISKELGIKISAR
ncbi:hypothetical protein OUHCRE1_34310 [Enterobacter asburiae]